MSRLHHSYGPTCQLAREGKSPPPVSGDCPPPVTAQFFYQSALPIDDPLSPLPPPSSTSSSAISRHPLRPFAPHDSAALEEAWQGLDIGMLQETDLRGGEKNAIEAKGAESQPVPVTGGDGRKQSDASHSAFVMGSTFQSVNPEDFVRQKNSVMENSRPWPSGVLKSRQELRAPAESAHSIAASSKQVDTENSNSKGHSSIVSGAFHAHGTSSTPSSQGLHVTEAMPMSYPPYRINWSERITTGTPFLRVPLRSRESQSSLLSVDHNNDDPNLEVYGEKATSQTTQQQTNSAENIHEGLDAISASMPDKPLLSSHAPNIVNEAVQVPVGISRLHFVELPGLEMKPIYWSPVNDISLVTRGTWFYRDTMLPVEAESSNQLELGYLDLKAWTETWTDELNSAVAVGAEGEAKVVQKLWPKEDFKRLQGEGRPVTGPEPRIDHSSMGLTSTEDLFAHYTRPDRPSEGLNHIAAEAHPVLNKERGKRHASSSVLYKNEKEAFILRPSLLPSSYYGRRPVAKIRKGITVGIPVVRGFDWTAWDKIHPPKKMTSYRAEDGAEASRSSAANVRRGGACPACSTRERQQKVTDLVLVIHGIGQKLSQRIESFHFTHLVNSLRRQIHIELGSHPAKGLLRPDHVGIMALPINWRATLSFDDSDFPHTNESGKRAPSTNQYGLKDITPETIPAVRNLIGDVMLDIPYYLSHHKPEMIEAVIREANRVYRLWCKNNTGFEKNGRVHLIAHSLGSIMALDILSKQPTRLPQQIDLKSAEINTRHFDFDTKNLVFCGSPAGFFLLLNRASLIPRKGRNKPGADGEDAGRRIAGEAGTYGCLAIDNIYNVLNYYDPIAYRLNGTVDRGYAASLKPALLANASTSFLASLGKTFGSSNPGGGLSSDASRELNRARLPSTIELETHDFTQEEIAERRMYLLNENGQIDYFLNSGGGPLEIQYLNILSAHSSYWASKEFVRFLVVEIGRAPGRESTLVNMRAVKKSFLK